MEILITIIIIAFAIFILYKNIKNSSKGKCNCSNCPTSKSKNCCNKNKDK